MGFLAFNNSCFVSPLSALLKTFNTFPSFFRWKGSGKCVLEAEETQQEVWRGKERIKEEEKCWLKLVREEGSHFWGLWPIHRACSKWWTLALPFRAYSSVVPYANLHLAGVCIELPILTWFRREQKSLSCNPFELHSTYSLTKSNQLRKIIFVNHIFEILPEKIGYFLSILVTFTTAAPVRFERLWKDELQASAGLCGEGGFTYVYLSLGFSEVWVSHLMIQNSNHLMGGFNFSAIHCQQETEKAGGDGRIAHGKQIYRSNWSRAVVYLSSCWHLKKCSD